MDTVQSPVQKTYSERLQLAWQIGRKRTGDKILLLIANPVFGFLFGLFAGLVVLSLLSLYFGFKTALLVMAAVSFVRVVQHLFVTAKGRVVLWYLIIGVVALLLSLA